MPDILRSAREAAANLWPLVRRGITRRGMDTAQPQRALWVVGGAGAVLALLVLLIIDWNPYKAQYTAFTPLFTLAAGLPLPGSP